MYKLLRPILFYGDAERTHEMITTVGSVLPSSLVHGMLHTLYAYEHPSLHQKIWGLDFPNPIGLAAGYDKDAKLIDVLSGLGFGFIEIGAVTPKAQFGNPKPRLFRILKERALVNRMGFNNDGLDTIAERIARKESQTIVGINIGKNKNTPNIQAVDDYITCFQKLQNLVDYTVINVSSPNTPGLRELQEKDTLKKILLSLQAADTNKKPILLKISPDLTEVQLNDIVGVVKETHIAGVIATNTIPTKDGGLSGAPLREQSTKAIRHLYKKSGGSFLIIGVGGIFSAQDAYEKIQAGASLVQVYTGLIYEGPGLVKKIKQGLVKLLQKDGFSNISEAIGAKT